MTTVKGHAQRPEDPVDLSSLVHQYQCREVLVRTLGPCLDCDACRRACEGRHGENRWHGFWRSACSLEMAPVCHACTDPLCVRACPHEGLLPLSGKPVVMRLACLGCGRCVRACPFQAISLAPLGNGGDTENARPRRRKIAVKCDGCAGYRNKACVQECPTGVLRFVEGANLASGM